MTNKHVKGWNKTSIEGNINKIYVISPYTHSTNKNKDNNI